MSRLAAILNYKANFPGVKIRGKSLPNSISLDDEASCFEVLADLTLPDGILSGMAASLFVGNNVEIGAGTWAIDAVQYTIPTITILGLSAQDGSLGRYNVVYANTAGALGIVAGTLAVTPLEPSIPNNTIKICAVLIPPPPGTITIINPPPTGFVDLTTNQSIDGIKIFLKSPQVPLAINNFDAVPFIQLTNAVNAIIDEVWESGSLLGTGVDSDPYKPNGYSGLTPSSGSGMSWGGSLAKATNIDLNEKTLTFTYHHTAVPSQPASMSNAGDGFRYTNTHGVDMTFCASLNNSAIVVAGGVSDFQDRVILRKLTEITDDGSNAAYLQWDSPSFVSVWIAQLLSPGNLQFRSHNTISAPVGAINFLTSNNGDIADNNGFYFLKGVVGTFVQLPVSPVEGITRTVIDSTTNTWGAIVSTGGGSNRVMVYYNGINWTVMAK